MNNLWEKSFYKSNIECLIDVSIMEFDIEKANINVLLDADRISSEQYQYLYNAPKNIRSITVGKMQGKDPSITQCLKNGISKARKKFLEMNNVQDSDILAIRNDSITVVNKQIKNLSITDNVKFRLSGNYRSYYHINYLDLFYNYDRISNAEVLDVKGLGKSAIYLHKLYMLDFLSELFYTAQIEGVENAITLLGSFYSDYIDKALSVGFYRELNPQSGYKVIPEIGGMFSTYMENASEWDKRYIDIGFNEDVLRKFNSIFASIYFKKRNIRKSR